MNTVSQQISVLMKNTKSIADQYGFSERYNEILRMCETAMHGDTSVLVCGEFKRGKSSFINAVLGEDVCVVNEGIATSVISIIRYGENRRVVRSFGNVSEDNSDIRSEEIPFDDISKFTVGNVDDVSDTVMLEIELPNPLLKTGFVFIDTPGVGSLDPRHLFLTLYALPKADVIFFMTDANEPITTTEVNFFSEYIAPKQRPVRVLIGKSDLKSTEELSVLFDDMRKNLTDKIKGGDVEILPVSSLMWSRFNKSQSEKHKERANVECVMNALELARKESNSCTGERIRSAYSFLLESIDLSISEQIAQIKKDSDVSARIEELQKKMNELEEMKRSLANPESSFRRNLNEILHKSQEQVLDHFQRQSIILSSEKMEALIDRESGNQGGEYAVAKEMNKNISELAEGIETAIDKSFEEVMNNLQEKLFFEETSFESNISGEIKAPNKSVEDKVFSTVQKSWFALPLAGIVSSIVWWPIGVATGVAYIVNALRGTKKQEREMSIRRQLAPRVTIALNDLRSYIQKRYDMFGRALLSHFSTSLEHVSQEMQNILWGIKRKVQKRKYILPIFS